MEILTAAQMRAVEQAAIESGEVTGLELMERAGAGVLEAIFEEWPELKARGASPSRSPEYLDQKEGRKAVVCADLGTTAVTDLWWRGYCARWVGRWWCFFTGMPKNCPRMLR